MEPLEDLFYELEAYTEGRMMPPERLAFEQRLRHDASLQTALHDYQLFRHSLDAITINEQLNSLHDRLEEQGKLLDTPPKITPEQRPFISWSRPARMLAAASVGLILLAGIVYFINQKPTVAEQTFLAFYHPEPTARGTRECNDVIEPGLRAYRRKNYAGALALFSELPASQPCVLYYRGIAHLAVDQPTDAIQSLQTARITATGIVRQKADWYLALAYLQANQPNKARRLLDTLSNQPQHPFTMVAQQALTRLAP